MARAKGFTKAEIISACITYQNGNGSLRSISHEMGCSMSTFKRWYLRYAEHGESAFDEINSHGRYSLEYKQEIIDYYLLSSESMEIVSAKYNLPYSTLKGWFKINSNSKESRDSKPKGDTTTMKSLLGGTYEPEAQMMTGRWSKSAPVNFSSTSSLLVLTGVILKQAFPMGIFAAPRRCAPWKKGPNAESY